MNRFSVLSYLLLYVSTVFAGNDFRLLDSLISRGNRAYELSQPSKIRLYADSVADIVNSGLLSGDALKDYSVSMLKLYGNYHYEANALDSAEYYYKKAKAIIDNNPDTDFHGTDLLMLRELAQLYYRQLRYEDAEDVMKKVDDELEWGRRPYLPGDDNWLISKLTYAMCLARLSRFDEALDIAQIELDNALNKSGLQYAKAERMYAKILLLANAGKVGASNAYRSYFSKQKDVALNNFSNMNVKEREEFWQTLRPFIADCYLLEDADPGLLFDVTLFSKGLLLQLSQMSGNGNASDEAIKTLCYNWVDIQKRLKNGEAAIEFIQYGEGDRQRMAALLLKPQGKPHFISLTPPGDILKIAGKALSSTDRSDKNRLYSDSTLQNLVWTDPLLKELQGVGKLFFAPDGYLHRLAIEYMPQVSHIDVCRLSSTRRLMLPKTAFPANSAMLAFGGINYDLDKAPGEHVFNDQDAYDNYLGMSFPNLLESTNETKGIVAVRDNPQDTIISGSKASEYAFRQLAPGFQSILLSTHGDFCSKSPVTSDIKPVSSDGAMSQSVIAFSGINSHLRDKAFDASGQCDGILSALELSELDLGKCRLFTASACQSALGEITSDGVFGLQRGLKNAGVDSMLLSLWSVNSEATAILMKEFYLNLNSGLSLRKAFSNARGKLLSDQAIKSVKYVFDPATMSNIAVMSSGKSFCSPQFTDAFVLIDAIE